MRCRCSKRPRARAALAISSTSIRRPRARGVRAQRRVERRATTTGPEQERPAYVGNPSGARRSARCRSRRGRVDQDREGAARIVRASEWLSQSPSRPMHPGSASSLLSCILGRVRSRCARRGRRRGPSRGRRGDAALAAAAGRRALSDPLLAHGFNVGRYVISLLTELVMKDSSCAR
jgi:hypothetical protein